MATVLASVTVFGNYLSIAKIVGMILLSLPWWYAAPLVHKDTRLVHARQGLWDALVLGGGVLLMAIWLVVPLYAAGLLVYVVAMGGILAAYVSHRNARVPEDKRVFTKDHLAILLNLKARKKLEVFTRAKLYGHDSKLVPPPNPEQADEMEVNQYNRVQELLFDIVWHRASEATLAVAGEEAQLRFVVDGVIVPQPALAPDDAKLIFDYIKNVAGLDPNEIRRPQKGTISADISAKRTDIIVMTAGNTTGQQMQFRIAQEVVRQQVESLGMSQDVMTAITKMAQSPGLLIVSGRGGSGVTSTLYSLIRAQDAYMKQLVTLEMHPAIQLENITQTTYDVSSRLAEALGPAVRRDPDVLLVDQCPDRACAELILEAASHKTVLLGMAAEDSFTALANWVKLCGDAAAATQPLNGVACQVLLRKLCQGCREAYTPDPQMLARANLPAKDIDKFYRPPSGDQVDDKGQPIICGSCHGSGYFERIGAFELLVLNEEIRQLIVRGGSVRDIKSACRKNKMLYLQEQALKHVIEGITSIQEVLRVSKK